MADTITIEALRNSNKGRLHYDRNWEKEGRKKQLLEEISNEIVSLNISLKSVDIKNHNTSIDDVKDVTNHKVEILLNSSPQIDNNESKDNLISICRENSEYLKLCETGWPILKYECERLQSVQEYFGKKIQIYEDFSSSLSHKFNILYKKLEDSKCDSAFQNKTEENIRQNKENTQQSVENQSNVLSENIAQATQTINETLSKTDIKQDNKTRLQEEGNLKQKDTFSMLKNYLSKIVNQIKLKFESCPNKEKHESQPDVRNLIYIEEMLNKLSTDGETFSVKENVITAVKEIIKEAEKLYETVLLNCDQANLKPIQESSSPLSVTSFSSVQPVQQELSSPISLTTSSLIQPVPELSSPTLLATSFPPIQPVKDSEIPNAHTHINTEQNLNVQPNFESSKFHIDVDNSNVENIMTEMECGPEQMEECENIEEPKIKDEKVVSPEINQTSPLDGELNTLREYLSSVEFLTNIENDVKSFASNPQFKKYKLELHKAVTTPINAISSCTSSHLRDKINRLISLLSGQMVSCGGKYTSCQNHPSALAYCKKLIAEKMVSQGEEQVASQFATAFPYAAVIVAICSKFPDVWTLILGQFYRRCPYLVPFYPPQEDGQSYKYVDDEIEEKDKFLKRMSGFMRLYAAILYTSSSSIGMSSSHLHGLARGWTWISQILNVEPRSDITATVIFDFLYVLGNSLEKTYGKQFKKILHVLCTDFFQSVKSVTAIGSAGPVSRLENFLQSAIKKGGIAPPNGILPSTFWRT